MPSLPLRPESIVSLLQKEISIGFQNLLSSKHLYQKVDLSVQLRAAFDKAAYSHNETFEGVVSMAWKPRLKRETAPAVVIAERKEWVIDFDVLHIHTACPICDEVKPFNPLTDGYQELSKSHTPLLGAASDRSVEQTFVLSFECQSCKKSEVRFLVGRSDSKIKITGRNPIDSPAVDPAIPAKQKKYIREAILQFRTGQVLGGIFFLRVFIEQFWRSVPEVAKIVTENSRGEDLGAAYNGTLDLVLRERFPSLSQIYATLSGAIHLAKEDAQIFEKALDEIIHHFRGKNLMSSVLTRPMSQDTAPQKKSVDETRPVIGEA